MILAKNPGDNGTFEIGNYTATIGDSEQVLDDA
jgi:hypothetical protein